MRLKKLPIISSLLVAALAIATLSSNSSGITGRSTVGCGASGCHGAQSASTVIALSGIPTGGWVPNTAYTLTLSVTNAAKVAAGFDMTVNVGSLTAGTGSQTVGTQEIRHNAPKNLVSGTTSWTFTWTAPATSTTPLTVDVACNAVNLNTVADANDNWNLANLTYNAAIVATAPTVVTTAATAITTSTATANGTVNANNANATVTIEYGTTTAYGNSGAATPGTVTGATVTNVSRALSGLAAGTTYHYRVVAVNSAGTTNGADMTFTTPVAVTAPTVTTGAATGVTTVAANLAGTVNANNGSTAVSFEYGTTTAYGSTAVASPATVTGATATNITGALSGLAPATTYHYRLVGTNSAGTTNGADMTFTTLTPATAPTVVTNAATSVAASTATGNGTVTANGANTTISVEYGTTTAYGSSAALSPNFLTASNVTPTAITASFSNLVPQTTYHYRFRAVNSAGTTLGNDMTFTTSAAAPTVFTTNASNITFNGATLNGFVNGNNSTASVTFQYGTTAAYGLTATAVPSVVSGTTNTGVSAALSGLSPNTLYHFRVVAVNGVGTTNGNDFTFTTTGVPAAPVAITNAATNVSATTATANGLVNANNAIASVTIEYGTTTAYGSTVSTLPASVSGNTLNAVSANLTGLSLGTLYHYRVSATNSVGTTKGADMTFTTDAFAITAPTVVTLAATNAGSNTATVNGTVNANNADAIVSIEYGPTTAYGSVMSANPATVTGGTVTPVTAALTNLSTSTTYHYRVVAVNSRGTTLGSDMTFVTLRAATPATVVVAPATGVGKYGATLNGTVNTNGANTTVSFEYGRSTAYGTTITANPGTVNNFTPGNVAAVVNGLDEATLYHFRIKATNDGGTVYSDDMTFGTTGLSIGTLNEGGFALYPNPAGELLMLSAKPGTVLSVEVFSLTGSKMNVPVKEVAAGQYQLDIHAVANGEYLLLLKAGDRTYSSRFTKQ